MSLQAP